MLALGRCKKAGAEAELQVIVWALIGKGAGERGICFEERCGAGWLVGLGFAGKDQRGMEGSVRTGTLDA